MKTMNIQFDIYALAIPKSRQDCMALAKEIIAELDIIDGHLDAAFSQAKAKAEGEHSLA